MLNNILTFIERSENLTFVSIISILNVVSQDKSTILCLAKFQ